MPRSVVQEKQRVRAKEAEITLLREGKVRKTEAPGLILQSLAATLVLIAEGKSS